MLAGEVPPLPARYSAELRGLVGAMLQQRPAARPTIDDVLQAPAVRRPLREDAGWGLECGWGRWVGQGGRRGAWQLPADTALLLP